MEKLCSAGRSTTAAGGLRVASQSGGWLSSQRITRGGLGTVVLYGRPSNFSLHNLALHKFEHYDDRKILGAIEKLPLTILLISFLGHGDVYFGVTEFECADCG